MNGQSPNALATLVQLEGLIRNAQSPQELAFLAVNETRRLMPYRQALLLMGSDRSNRPYHVVSASSVAAVERDAPMIRWLESLVQAVRRKHPDARPIRLSEAECPAALKSGWKEFASVHALWCPLRHPDQSILGGLWLDREFPWQDQEITIIQRAAETYAHAWKALNAQASGWRKHIPKPAAWIVMAGLLALLCLPVRLSTVAPVKVVVKEPAVVSAPMDGVIADVLVSPNSMVTEGQTILRFEDTNLRNQYEVAEQQLAVARAEHHQAVQSGFLDAERKAAVPLKEAEARLRETERDYARELLGRVDVKALRSGLLLYSDKADWIGRPVVVGERIMEIADPTQVELRVDLPVRDAIVLHQGAEARVFLDALPLESLEAIVTHTSYHAEPLPGDILAYRVTADLVEPTHPVRIGWQGTAKLYGDRRPLALLLFRRPLTVARQFLGL